MFTGGYILHRLNQPLGTKLGLFLVRSTFLLAHGSLWPFSRGTSPVRSKTYSLIINKLRY